MTCDSLRPLWIKVCWTCLSPTVMSKPLFFFLSLLLYFHVCSCNRLTLRSYSVKYAFWTGAIGAHLVDRCVLHSYRQCSILKSWWSRFKFSILKSSWSRFKFSILKLRLDVDRQASTTSYRIVLWNHVVFRECLKLLCWVGDLLQGHFCAPMLKRKLNMCMMSCDGRLRRVSKSLTNWHLLSHIKSSCIRGKSLCVTCSNHKVWTFTYVKKKMRTQPRWILKHVRT